MTVPSTPRTLALFGASGDLTRRKLGPALYLLHQKGCLPSAFHVVGYGRKPMTDEAFREQLRAGIREFMPEADAGDAAWSGFAANLHYVSGEYDRPEDLRRLADTMEKLGGPEAESIYYLALPPEASEKVLAALAGQLDRDKTRLLLEKPFGYDYDSAKAANDLVAKVLPERRVHRVDHYLAKAAVRNLLVFRFGNAFFEPIWNRHHIDHIQIVAAETVGTDGRAGYYDHAGAVRDMLQNHVLAMLALVMMEPPTPGREDSLRDRIAETLASLMPLTPEDFIFGQYEGYLDESGVAPDSHTPTYAAARFEIDSWRWRGVPVYVRTGKRLAKRVSEIAVVFKSLPSCVFGDDVCERIAPNILTLRIQPHEAIRISLNVRAIGSGNRIVPSALSFSYDELARAEAEAEAKASKPSARHAVDDGQLAGLSDYPLVLWETLMGGTELCWRADGILAAWKAVAPMLARVKPHPYAPGGWGPDAAEELPRRHGHRWHKSAE